MPIVTHTRKRPICGECGSGYVYTKKRATIIVCRNCGAETDAFLQKEYVKEEK